MRRIWAGLAILSVAAVLSLYLANGERRARTLSTRPSAASSAEPEAAAPEAPPPPEAKVARIRVVDTDGKAIADAAVGRAKAGKPEGETVKTGADGRCELPLPDAEWHEISVSHPDFVRGRAFVRATDPDSEVTLQRGTQLTVLVLDPLRKPVAGAAVGVTWEQSHGASGVWRWSEVEDLGQFKTAADGRAAIGAVPPATIVVKVDCPPFALVESRLDATGEAPIEHVVQLDSGGILLGRVVRDGGEGVPGATVKCQGLARPVATSGPGGEFRLEGVAPGSVELVAEAEGFGPGFFGAALGWGQPVPIPLKSGETIAALEIVLSTPVFVVGRIVDDERKPVKEVSVWTAVQGGFALGGQAKSDEDGRFRAGPYSMRQRGQVWAWFHAPDHTIEQAGGIAEPGKDVDLGEIKATRDATVRGILVDEAGSAVEGRVRAQLEHAGDAFTPSKPDGTFELTGIAPGSIKLVGSRSAEPVLKSQPLPLEVAAGQTIDGIRLVLLPAKPIRGRVITPEGGPRPGAIVGIRPASGGTLTDRAWTDKEGAFAFNGLAEGEYEVGLAGTGSGSVWDVGEEQTLLEQPAPVKVRAGSEDLEFIFPLKGGIVTGKVVAKKDGRPIKEFDATFLRYKLFIPSDSEFESFDGPEGDFRYEVDEPGTWQVDISATGYAAHRTDRFSLAAGEVKDLGTIRLGPGGTIAGTVLDAQQRPVPYARVNILNDKLQTNDDEPFTDLEGRFEVPGVSPGVFTVFAVSPRHPLGMVRNVTVREDERTNVQITFVEAAPLTIDVRDTSGQPVEGAALDFTFPAVAPLTSKLFRGKIPPGYGSHKSDAQGTIFQPCLPPGEVTVTIEADGFDPVTKKLELKPGEPNRVEIRLRHKDGG